VDVGPSAVTRGSGFSEGLPFSTSSVHARE
jgi:hypothetical protein